MEVYFDSCATTKPSEAAVKALENVIADNYGNPSSLHRMGLNAENIIKDARRVIAKKLGAQEDEIIFTSGGTESNNLAIMGACGAFREKKTVITSKIEHKSVSECFSQLEKRGYNVIYLDVNENGTVNTEQLEQLANADTQLVSIMHVNNETGAIQPIEKISEIIKHKCPEALLHTDAVQGFLKIPLPKNTADIVSVSAHKINGLKGTGALYVRKGVRLTPVIYGGGQEHGMRNGTENVPGIAAFAAAAESYPDSFDKNAKIRSCIADYAEKNIDGCLINSPSDGSPYILNLSVLGFKSETILHILEQSGIYVSSGSACSSNRPQLSAVLTAMGYGKQRVESSIRISFGSESTIAEAEYFCETLFRLVRDNRLVRRKWE